MPNHVSAIRPRNSADTRSAILEAARRQFTQGSYDSVGMRQVAAEVGVDKALVNRYFGSKEDLFREVLRSMAPDIDFSGPIDVLCDRMAADLVAAAHEDDRQDGLCLMLQSAASPSAAQIVSDNIRENVITPMARNLDGDDAEERACLAVAVALGVKLMGRLLGVSTVSDDECPQFQARLARTLKVALAK